MVFLDKVLVLFVVVLIISITPASASLMSYSSVENESYRLTSDDQLEMDIEKLEAYSTDIIECKEYILDNTWKFWNWGAVLSKMYQIKNDVDIIQVIMDEVEDLIKRSQRDVKLQNKDRIEILNESAEQNAQKIQKRLAIRGIVLNIGSAIKINPGDIIQYKSQNKYYRYLQYIKSNNNTVFLNSTHNQTIKMSNEDFRRYTKIKLTSDKPAQNTKIINTIYNIQENELQNKIDSLKKANKTRTEQYESTERLFKVGAVLFGLGLIGLIISVILTTKGARLGQLLFIPVALFSIGLGVMIAAYTSGVDFLKDLERLGINFMSVLDELGDLCSFGNSSLIIAPVANNMSLVDRKDHSLNRTLNATSVHELLTYENMSAPAHGTLKLVENGQFIYTPDENYTGTDCFLYRANNGVLNSNTAIVMIEIQPDIPPVANNMSFIIKRNQLLNKTLSITNFYKDILTFEIVSKPQHGTLTINPLGFFIYVPFKNYIGEDSFIYKVNNGFTDSNNSTITINIHK